VAAVIAPVAVTSILHTPVISVGIVVPVELLTWLFTVLMLYVIAVADGITQSPVDKAGILA
jgi:hypothetical protein